MLGNLSEGRLLTYVIMVGSASVKVSTAGGLIHNRRRSRMDSRKERERRNRALGRWAGRVLARQGITLGPEPRRTRIRLLGPSRIPKGLRALADRYRIEEVLSPRGGVVAWRFHCRRCSKAWELKRTPGKPLHGGNVLRLLDHALGHEEAD
jgi:hypothetical protein